MFRLVCLAIVATLLGATPTPSGHATSPSTGARATQATHLQWQGPAGGLWSTPGNWAGGDGKLTPQSGDSVSFDQTNTDSKNDVANLSIAKLTLASSYTSTLTLDNDLTVTGGVSLHAAKIAGPKTL